MTRILLIPLLALAITSTAAATQSTCPFQSKEKKECPALSQGKEECDQGKLLCQRPKPNCRRPMVTVEEKDGWKLAIHTLQPGTRSQGYHGELSIDGKRVLGKERGEKMEGPLGTLIWLGSMEERANLWDETGWKLQGSRGAVFAQPPQTSMEDLESQLKDELSAQ